MKLLSAAGAAILLAACLPSEDPTGPACDNTAVLPCPDCDTANPGHAACYDAFTREVLPVFGKYCLGCHGPDGIGEFLTGGADSGLNFAPAVAYARLMMPSFGDSGTTRRIVPGHPEASALFNKVTADAPSVWFGAPMPQGKALIHTSPEGVESIRQWIAGGAKPPRPQSGTWEERP